MPAMPIAPMRDYDQAVRDFRWELPATFNFGRDVVDAIAARDDRLALLATGEHRPTRRLLFSDVARASAQYARVMQRAGLRAGDRIVVQLPRIPEWHVAMTACAKLGAIPVPCVEMLTAKDLEYRIGHCGALGVVTTPDNLGKFAACAQLRMRACIGEASGWLDLPAEAAREPGEFACADTPAESPAIIYYTSGSSGMPKGVTHSARALHAWRVSAVYWQSIGPGDLNWCTADTGWAKSGTGSLYSPWGAGAAVMFHDGPFDPARRLQLIAEHGVTVFCAAATEFRRMIQLDVAAFDLSRLRLCVSAGESVNPEVVNRWRELSGVELLDGYGQTETLMTILNYRGMTVKPGSMGKPLPGTRFEVVDPETGEQVPAGSVGQIAMALPSPLFMLGYWNDPERTRAAVRRTERGDRWLTGDMGYVDADGYYFYTGRADDIIGSAGYRIGPMEVENALMEHPAVLEVAVVGKPDAQRGEIVKAYVVLKPGFAPGDALAAELQAFVKRVTAPYKYPREIEFRNDLPKSTAGKLLRRVLRSEAAQDH